MTPEEINRKIGKEIMQFPPDGWPYPDGYMVKGSIWSPYTNIAHAWMVVDKGLWFNPYCLYQYGDGWAIGKLGDFQRKPIVSADTAPAAICLAALKIVEEKPCTGKS